MKHLLHLLIALFITSFLYAQAPQKMTYQAVIRDASSNLIQNKSIGIRISLLQGSPTGTSVYAETHTASTNSNGLVTIEVGGGTALSSSFSSINWSKGPYYIKTEVDPTGGNSYTITGSSQLLSVPYALYAATSGSSTGSTDVVDSLTSTSVTSALSANQGYVLKSMIDKITGGTTKLTGDVTSNGNTTKVVKLQGNTVSADAPVVGQTLQYNGLVWTPATPTLSGDVSGNYNSTKVTQLQNIPVAVTAPANGQTLRFNGVAWIPDYPLATNVEVYPQIPGIYATNVQDAIYQLKQQIVVAAGGGITSVYHDSTMSGSGISGSPLGIADGAISSTKLADKSVSLSKLADISTNTLLGRSTSGSGSPEAITIGSGLTLSGGILTATASGSGTITGVTAGSGLTGGGTTGNITVGLDAIPSNTILANTSATAGTPSPVTASQLKTLLNLGNIDNTSDLSKPISTATQSAMDLKEDKINKSTDGTLASNSDTKFPTEKAVKTYVDSKVISGGGGISSVTHDSSLSGAGTSGDPLLIPNQAITLSKMANMNNNYIIGRASSGSGQPEYLQIGTGLSLSGGTLSTNGITGINAINGLISAGTSGTITVGMSSINDQTILGNNSGALAAPTAINMTTLKSMLNISKSDLGLTNIDNTSDLSKPISTATQTALNLKEDKANKSTDGTFASVSDTQYPSTKAVKTYVDSKVPAYSSASDANKVLTVNSTGTGVIWATPASGGGSGSGSVTGVSVVTANGFQGSASSGAVPNITIGTTITGLLKGDATTGVVTAATAGSDYISPSMTANKLLGSGLSGTAATEITLGTNLSFTGNTLNATGGSPATTSSLGTVQLAGDLGGTATAPTVPGLTGKAPLASPAFTGTPTAPTAAVGTNTTQIATTAFVLANAGGTPASTSALGTVQLAGDLGGTATAPSIATNAVTTAKIAANAVTYAKMQAMSASKLLLGSSASGTAVSEISLGTGLSITGSTLNSIAPTPASTDAGKVLTANGTGSATWQTASGGSSLPASTTSDANKVLTVNASGTPIWINPTQAPGAQTGPLYGTPVRTVTSAGPIVWSATDVGVILLPGYSGDVVLPSASANKGRIVGINNRSGGVRLMANTTGGDTGIYGDEGWSQLSALVGMVYVISDGTSWRLYSGRP